MQDTTTPEMVLYMIRHYLTANIVDPLSNSSRAFSTFTQYFAGTGASAQLNYLERIPSTGGSFIVSVNGVLKDEGIDFTVDRTLGSDTSLSILWTGYTPPIGTGDTVDNIQVVYQAVNAWVYDEHSDLSINTWPRITVDNINTDYKIFQIGEYYNYANTAGNWVVATVKIVVRAREKPEFYTYQGYKYKNFDLVNAISQNVKVYFKTHANPARWRFYKWDITNIQRIRTEEDNGIFRNDITLILTYFDNGVV